MEGTEWDLSGLDHVAAFSSESWDALLSIFGSLLGLSSRILSSLCDMHITKDGWSGPLSTQATVPCPM